MGNLYRFLSMPYLGTEQALCGNTIAESPEVGSSRDDFNSKVIVLVKNS